MKLIERVADIKSVSRSKQYLDIRNSLSLCGLFGAINTLIDPSLLFTSDDVSLMINKWDKPRVLVTSESIKVMDGVHVGVSVTQQERKQRSITYNCTIGVDRLLCTVIKIIDSKFHDYKLIPKIFAIETDLFVLCGHTELSDYNINKYQYKCCIIPTVLKFQRDLIASVEGKALFEFTPEIIVPNVSSSSSEALNPPPVQLIQSTDPIILLTPNSDEYKYIGLACDGAGPQIKVINEYLIQKSTAEKWNILFIKYCAGCSMTQSPNDVGKMHSILKQYTSAPDFRYEDSTPDPVGPKWDDLKQFLFDKQDTASSTTYWKCLKHSRDFIHKAFQPKTIKSAFKGSGIHPFSPEYIMSKNPHFSSLQQADAEIIISMMPELKDYVIKKGYVTENEFKHLLEPYPGIDNCEDRAGMELNEMVTNRQRGVILNHEKFLEMQEILKKKKEKPSNTQGSSTQKIKAHHSSSSTLKRPRSYYCSNGECVLLQDELNSKNMTKCIGSYCRTYYCDQFECVDQLAYHESSCPKVDQQKVINSEV